MRFTTSRINMYGARLAALLSSASLATLANAIADKDRAYAGEAMVAQNIPEEIPENVLITGSLIRGTVAVGVPVVNLSPMDFATTGSLTTADLFKNFPAATVNTGETATESGARVGREAKVNIRGLDSGTAPRSLMMVDGMRFPPQSNGQCAQDPSIIPSISLDHIDILVDGSSATYGSDAISGVINLILRRNYDGAQTQLRYTDRAGGGFRAQVGQLWGRTWDGGQITLSYEWYDESPAKGNAFSMVGVNHSPWGYDDRTPLGSSSPGIITKAPFPSNQLGTACGYFNVPSSNLASTPSTCYAVPLGSGTSFLSSLNAGIGPLSRAEYAANGAPLDWTALSGNTNFAGPLNPSAGTRNEFNPYSRIWYDAVETRNGGAVTLDQRLTKDISFYGSGFYSNRRSLTRNQNFNGQGANNGLSLIAVPTFNPYYPVGTFCPSTGTQPANCLPTNLRVSYDISVENTSLTSTYEVADRYQVGLNIALPASWEGQVFYSETYDSSFYHTTSAANKNAVSAALGWTINAIAPNGTAPAFGSFTRPAAVPYLNLFCDPFAFQCNSPLTLNYLSGYASINERFWINEKGVKTDGPLFDLPGGTVKMAIGANLTSSRLSTVAQTNVNTHDLTINPIYDAEGRSVWAVFSQINLPVFGDNFNLPGFRRLEFELSWRHDQYSDVAGTSNPKIAFNWAPFEDLTIKGAWGTNFRAPVFGEISPIANVAIAGFNLPPAVAVVSTNAVVGCTAGGALPEVGSGAYKYQSAALAFNNAMAAAGAPGYTPTSTCVTAMTIPQPGTYTNSAGEVFTSFANLSGFGSPQGISMNGGSAGSDPIRQVTRDGLHLQPELATNWGIGFDYAPTNILRGLDIQATYYIVKINGVLRGFGNPTTGTWTDPARGAFAYVSPADVACPDLPNSVVPSIPIPANLVPSACPQYQQMIAGLVANPRAAVVPLARTLMYWINDGGTFNKGWQRLDGIDWNLSYDWDMGNIGAFNIGATGTYYLHQVSVTQPGDPGPGGDETDPFNTTVTATVPNSVGVNTTIRSRYRSRLGWANGPWNVTGFMDYQGHFWSNQSQPPNVNNTCVANGVAVGGGTFPCAQNNYSNQLPNWYGFDLSIGYDTGEDPANDYLKNIGLQVIIQNIMDKHGPYAYRTQTNAGQPCTCEISKSQYGRQISFVITKTW